MGQAIRRIRTGVVVAATVLAVHGPAGAGQTVGLLLNSEDAFEGYTLFAPVPPGAVYLIDNAGKQVHSWPTQGNSNGGVYLLENGNLLRTRSGSVQELAWDGAVLWEYATGNPNNAIHHDIEPLPNGNVLMIVHDTKSAAEAIAAGRDPGQVGNHLKADQVIEVQPAAGSGGTIVWEWHVWDHLVQDFDPTKANFGVVADNPGLVDVNYGEGPGDWTHVNAIDYNDELDQIVLSARNLHEIWVIDHSTTSEEAAGHTGGGSGSGGDLLYRWGNPEAYDRGGPEDQQFYSQHDSRWVEPGLPGAGNITVFNNVMSSVDEIVPPVDEFGDYALADDAAYGPAAPVWSYTGGINSAILSGAHRLPNGNTLICAGTQGLFLEVTQAGVPAWQYVNPVGGSGPVEQGQPAGFWVFRAHRYAPDYPGFDGKELIPGDPIELFDAPLPVPDGSGATLPLTCEKGASSDSLQLHWDASSCPAERFNLIFGYLAQVEGYTLQGAECTVGTFDGHDWTAVPAGDLYFLVVGTDDTGCYESSWGRDGSGNERNGTSPSNLCGVTTKDVSEVCR